MTTMGPAVLTADRALEPLDARLLVEPHVAYLAARHHAWWSHHPRELPAEVLKVGHGQDQRAQGSAFHRLMAHLSGSSVFTELVSSFLEPARPGQALIGQCDMEAEREQEHLAIFDAMRLGADERASELALAHLLELRAAVVRQLPLYLISPLRAPTSGLVAPEERRPSLTLGRLPVKSKNRTQIGEDNDAMEAKQAFSPHI